jgi:hypothetical protein
MLAKLLLVFLLQFPLIYMVIEGISSVQGGELNWQGLLIAFVLLAMYDFGEFLRQTSKEDEDL